MATNNTPAQDDALLPCPFCQEKKISIFEEDWKNLNAVMTFKYAKCVNCGAQNYLHQWNIRVPSAPSNEPVSKTYKLADVDIDSLWLGIWGMLDVTKNLTHHEQAGHLISWMMNKYPSGIHIIAQPAEAKGENDG